MRILLSLLGSLLFAQFAAAATATNELRTHFASNAVLSSNEVASVVKLAKLCGIDTVAEVNTERTLRGKVVFVRGDERIDNREIASKTLWVHRDIWEKTNPPTGSRSMDGFWAEPQAHSETHTIVKIRDETLRIRVENGIKPAGVGKILDAFLTGRVRFSGEAQSVSFRLVQVKEPKALGIANKTLLWITFSPNTHVHFTMKGDEVVVSHVTERYE